MSEFKNRFGECVFHEGVSPSGLDGFEAGFNEWVIRNGERKAGDDDVAKGFALNVDPHPETIEPEENACMMFSERFEHFSGGEPASLNEKAVAFGFEFVAKFVGDVAHKASVGEENKGAGL